MDYKNMKYVIVPLDELRDLKLNSTDKLVMGMIVSLSIKKGMCKASNGYLSKQLELSKRTITKSLSILKDNNLIRIEKEKNQRVIYFYGVWNNTSVGIEENFYPP